ncbi:LLM class flavin-dependent oxidoreductase [Nakamurella deserti]|uniref:LLM class flavin-dependent oxidoreductase n=1 Tax=Nakamurella deserti TaxID=2164074 RepID=UPI000DBE4ECC|nr:LLM class flavin-dependent oxidoreductase [Nakamurella deserti]
MSALSHAPLPAAATAGPVFHWFLPTRGDSENPGVIPAFGDTEVGPGRRPPTLDYLTEVAQAAEQGGFHSALTPVGIGCPDPWVVCSAIAGRTSRLGFIVALRPSTASPTLVAQQADTFTALHGRRLTLNIVTGGDPVEQAAYGDHTDHDGRYDKTAEALDVITPLLAGRRTTVRGTHFDVRDAALVAPTGIPVPIYFGGASPAALQVAARQADTYLLWGEPLPQIAARISRMRELAAAHGRSLRFGLRMHVLARDTADEAWAEADRIQAAFDPAVVASVQERMSRMDSVGQARMASLHGGTAVAARATELTVGPNLWAGIGLVREGAGTALVGSYDEVAERLDEYSSVGVDEFILSGYPHREEALRVGRHVLPRVGATLR